MNSPTRSLNIAIVLPNLHWHGGSQVGLVLAEAMAAAGHTVEVIVINPAWRPMSARPVPAVPTTFLAATNLPSAVKRLRGRMAERDIDVAHAIGDIASMILGLACYRLTGRPHLLIGSEHFPVSAKFGDFTHLKGRVAGFIMRLAYRQLDATICVNHDLQERMVSSLGWDRSRCPVIHNPVRLPFADPTEVETERQHRRERNDHFVVAAAGALQVRKDYPTLLRAFALASESVPLRLRIAGEGEELSALQHLYIELGIESRVEFLGAVSDMEGFFCGVDVFAFSSTQESFGLVLVESLSQGVPVVSTDCKSGPSEVIETSIHGQLVPVGDYRALAAALTEIVAEPPRADILIERARDFSRYEVTDHYLEYFFRRLGNDHRSV